MAATITACAVLYRCFFTACFGKLPASAGKAHAKSVPTRRSRFT
jgi:hypothetical protein